jgi:cysteine synthase
MKPSIFHQVYEHFNKLPFHQEFIKGNSDLKYLFGLENKISEERKIKYKKLYQGIGNTHCYSVNLPNNNRLKIKMEYSNSMGNNHYARYWIPYLFIAESLELIKPGKTKIIEVTSGSAGIALAMATKELEFDTTIIVPKMLPKNRLQPMIDYGAKLELVDGYIDKCIEKFISLVKQNDYFPTNHSEEKSDFIVNVFSRIGKEFLSSYKCPDYAVIGLGNGTTTYSVFSEFKNRGCNTKCISYHPDLTKSQLVFGLYGPNVNLKHIEMANALTDEKIFTNDIYFNEIDEYFKNDTEIINLGPSSKYGIAIAYNIAKTVSKKTFLTIGYDKNDRY